MRSLHRVLLAAILIAPAATAQLPTVPPQRTTAFVDVTVIPMTARAPAGGPTQGATTIPRQTVIVRDGRIAVIGPTQSTPVPPDALRIDAAGKFLIPGLAEMHGHVPAQAGAQQQATMFLYLANGLTTVRGMQGAPSHLQLRDQVARGEVLGPRFYPAGPQLATQLRTPAIGDSVARAQKAAGYDLLKIQEGLPRASYDAVVKAAREIGIPFGGHVPDEVGLWHALASRQGTIDHLDNYSEAITAPDFPAGELTKYGTTQSRARYAQQSVAVAGATVAAGIAVVPTMALWENLYIPFDSAYYASRPELKYISRGTLAGWYRTIAPGGRVFGDSARREWKALRMMILKDLDAAGAKILLGTDAPQLFSVPGFSIHREMQSMVDAGMTPYRVLLSGTRNVAEHFGTLATTGTIEVGKRADLVLLDANPITSIANTQQRAGVMIEGRWLPGSEIQRGLAWLAAEYAR